jgi:hypothetical protein
LLSARQNQNYQLLVVEGEEGAAAIHFFLISHLVETVVVTTAEGVEEEVTMEEVAEGTVVVIMAVETVAATTAEEVEEVTMEAVAEGVEAAQLEMLSAAHFLVLSEHSLEASCLQLFHLF